MRKRIQGRSSDGTSQAFEAVAAIALTQNSVYYTICKRGIDHYETIRILARAMEPEFADNDLQRLETDPTFDGDYGWEIVRAFRKRMQFIRAARDERDFYAMKSLHFEQLKGDRIGQHSMRLNKQWRLILKLVSRGNEKIVVVVEIADYH